MTAPDTLEIARRFRGPPQSGNGGYVCGLLGLHVNGVATVRLLAPPPLDTPLQLAADDGLLHLRHGATPVARAQSATLDLQAPPAPTLEQARDATKRFAGFGGHPFPGCFVCGPARAKGDGLRIFPGRVAGRDLVAAPWQPSADLADANGELRAEFVWSALDCSGFFAFGPLADGSPAVLGELTARIDGAARADEPHVVAGWLLGAEGRKRYAGSALYDARGVALAVARATWIVLAPGAAGAVSPDA